jgi:hypothetical protein
VPNDLQRILAAAVKAALEEPAQAAPSSRKSKKRRLSTGRAMLLGAGLVTAGRVVVGHKGRDMLGRVQQRMADSEWLADGGSDDEVEDYEDYEPDRDAAHEEELADEDKEVDDDTPDEEQESDADPEQDEDEAEDEAEDEPGPERPGAPRKRRRGRA